MSSIPSYPQQLVSSPSVPASFIRGSIPVPIVETVAPPVPDAKTPGSMGRDCPVEDPFGLKVLAEGTSPNVDLVAVHGLDGHREDTWKADNGVLWLRDYLPQKIPNIRIMTWGYDGRTHDSVPLSCQSIHDHAVSLITDLSICRRESNTQERPVIFIVHGVGGIIVKDALIHSNAANKDNLEYHSAVKTSTCGVLFFGTPHQGTDSISWPQILRKTVSAMTKKNKTLLRDVEKNSTWLQKQIVQYTHISEHFETKFFYETRPPAGSNIIVPPGAAIIAGLRNAEAFAINSDHEGLVKYKAEGDAGFRKVSLCISLMVDEAPEKAAESWERRRLVVAAEENDGVKITFEIPFELEYLRNQRFTGRESLLNAIHAMIEDNTIQGQSTPIVLHGTGGIGKSQIVVEYLYAHHEEHSSVFWINSATPETVVFGFRAAAQRLIKQHAKISLKSQPHYPSIAKTLGMVGAVDESGLLVPGEDHNDCIIDGMKLWFSQKHNRNWLLVFDNVDDLETLKINTFMPSAAAGTIIMTSRRPDCVHFGVGLEVNQMTEQEGVQLLVKTAGLRIRTGDSTDHIASEVTKELGSLPLALAQAGAYVAARRIPLKKYLEIYRESFNQAFAKKLPRGVWTYEDRSVLNTWEISFKAIEEVNESAAELLSVCPFLFHEVGEDLLRRGGMVKAGDFTLDESLELLYSYSLAQPQITNSGFYIHPVVHRWAHERLDDSQRVWKTQDAVILVTSAVRYSGNKTIDNWNYERKIIAHIDSVTKNAQRYLRGTVEVLPLAPHMRRLSEVNSEWGRMDEALSISIELSKAAQEVLGESNSFTMSAMSNQVSIYNGQGRYDEAEKLAMYVIEVSEKNCGPEHPQTLEAMANLAGTYLDQNRLDQAEKLNLRVIEAMKKTLGLGHPGTLTTMGNLARTYLEQGRLDEVGKLNLDIAEATEKNLGLEHPHAIRIMRNLASRYGEQGQLDEAVMWDLQALEVAKKHRGLEHPDTFSAMNGLALNYASLGRFTEAHELLLNLVDASDRILGKNRQDSISHKNNLTLISWCHRLHRGDDIEVEAELTTQKQGDDVLDMLAVLEKTSKLYILHDRLPEAEQLLEQVIKGREKALGGEHGDTLSSISSLAWVYSNRGRWDEAEKLQQRIIETRRRVLGSDHPDTLSAISSLVSTYAEQNRWEEAEVLHKSVLDVKERKFGRNHPCAQRAMAGLSVIHHKLGRYQEAHNLRSESVESGEGVPGFNYSYTIEEVKDLAISYALRGRVEYLQRLLIETAERLGNEEIITVFLKGLVSAVYDKSGRYGEASILREEMTEALQRKGIDAALVEKLVQMMPWDQFWENSNDRSVPGKRGEASLTNEYSWFGF